MHEQWVLFDLDKNEYVADIGTYVLSGTKLYETTPLVKKAYHFTDEEKNSKNDTDISKEYDVSVVWKKLTTDQVREVLKYRECNAIRKQVENYLDGASKKEAADLLDAIFDEYNMNYFCVDEKASDLLYFD